MLESLDRDFVASCVGEELRMLEQAAVRRSASRQGCRWRPWGIYGVPAIYTVVLFMEPRLLTCPVVTKDTAYKVRFDMDDYIILWSFPNQRACPANIAGLIICITTADFSPTNHGSIDLGTV